MESEDDFTMTKDEQILLGICYAPHPETRVGNIKVSPNVSINSKCRIDVTGDVEIGEYCMIGEGTQILTHDHYHEGREHDLVLLLLQKEKGVKWQNKKIGRDVWLHGCIVLYQVTEIPDGTVVGIGSVLSKNPEAPYGIYAGNPARRVGER